MFIIRKTVERNLKSVCISGIDSSLHCAQQHDACLSKDWLFLLFMLSPFSCIPCPWNACCSDQKNFNFEYIPEDILLLSVVCSSQGPQCGAGLVRNSHPDFQTLVLTVQQLISREKLKMIQTWSDDHHIRVYCAGGVLGVIYNVMLDISRVATPPVIRDSQSTYKPRMMIITVIDCFSVSITRRLIAFSANYENHCIGLNISSVLCVTSSCTFYFWTTTISSIVNQRDKARSSEERKISKVSTGSPIAGSLYLGWAIVTIVMFPEEEISRWEGVGTAGLPDMGRGNYNHNMVRTLESIQHFVELKIFQLQL